MPTVTTEHSSKDESDERPEQMMFGQKLPRMKIRSKVKIKDIQTVFNLS